MRAYPVPVQLEGEERVVGGFLTLRQLIYLVLGAVLGGGAACGAFFLPLVLRFIVFFLFAGAGTALALVPAQDAGLALVPAQDTPAQDTGLDVFLYRWLKWRLGQREFSWRGDC